MPPGESSCPGDSEYVWQRGVEGISGRVMELSKESAPQEFFLHSALKPDPDLTMPSKAIRSNIRQ